MEVPSWMILGSASGAATATRPSAEALETEIEEVQGALACMKIARLPPTVTSRSTWMMDYLPHRFLLTGHPAAQTLNSGGVLEAEWVVGMTAVTRKGEEAATVGEARLAQSAAITDYEEATYRFSQLNRLATARWT